MEFPNEGTHKGTYDAVILEKGEGLGRLGVTLTSLGNM